MYSTASPTVRIFSASSSEISVPNSSSRLMIELDQVERVGVQVVDERRLGLDFFLVDAELLDDDLLEAVVGAGHWLPPRGLGVCSASRLACDPPEDAVHEASHRVAAVDPGQFDPLGDGHPGRRRGV